jgi:hypothetical protein
MLGLAEALAPGLRVEVGVPEVEPVPDAVGLGELLGEAEGLGV